MAMRSGQVAVGVLLSVHSLQVLLLYQDVDAFLATRGRQSAQSAKSHIINTEQNHLDNY